MATPKLEVTSRKADAMLDVLDGYRADSLSIDIKYQYFIAEVIMLRLFSVLEQTIEEVAYKLVAGGKYLNGNNPVLSVTANSVAGARTLLLNHGRSRPVQNLKWTKSQYIRQSVQHVIDVSDAYVVNAQVHGSKIDEMRKVRNHLAHRNTSTRREYNRVIRNIYGANIRLQTGPFLISTKRTAMANIERYIRESRIIIDDLIKG